ncbi:phage tail assembly protein [Burkholderia sp. PAMC 28687]|uniref:phage tail assembly protein n=1 Tax=Burkholderia sp. PAMC 28687 TaxID=1795874 RepID=UPI00155FAAE8|nr:phage tail assembly protein [Burkholderia sp. PAMC 28687]
MDVINVKPTLKLRLKRPVMIGSGRGAIRYTDLALACPTKKQAERAAKAGDDMDQLISMLALVAEVPAEAIERLGARDFAAACRFMSQFGEDEYGE